LTPGKQKRKLENGSKDIRMTMFRVTSVGHGKKVEVEIDVTGIMREASLHALVLGLISVVSLLLL
jgi:hypothetical protein